MRGIVAFLGLYQGAVPLVTRGVFDRDQRFAPALWLSAPWWWITCIAITATAAVLVALITRWPLGLPEAAHSPPTPVADEQAEADSVRSHATGSDGYEVLSGLVFLIGIYNGVAPFMARLVFDSNLLLAFPLRLPAPWWWITSLAVIAVTAALLVVIEHAK